MLYVFHVDCGRMMKFDMNMALSKVESLKSTIESLFGFSAVHQVLLVSGGEMLQPGSMVCSYSAGTDTNPIYMFTTEDHVDSKNNKIPWPSIEPPLDIDLKDQVEKCLALPATYSTVVQRAQLSQQIFDIAREEESICGRLVHEQHLQQQGWSAVVANMEDLVADLKERLKHFSVSFEIYFKQRDSLGDVLKTFESDIETLSRIPVLPTLLKGVEYDSNEFDKISETDICGEMNSLDPLKQILQEAALEGVESEAAMSKSQALVQSICVEKTTDIKSGESSQQMLQQISLLQWMSLKDKHLALKTMSDECLKGIEMLDDRKIQSLKLEIANVLKMAEQDEIKEIKGLEDRLCGLEKLMFDLKNIVQEQRELSTAFQQASHRLQNQNRASNLGDPSILPDLCASHRSQLLVMLQSQRTIHDIRRRISKAKEELSTNLFKRLKYIVRIENTMLELSNTLLFYHRCLRRIDSHLSVIRQIHQAPRIYLTAVIEVVRRRLYSTAFSSWASSLASDLLSIYKDEITRRQEFDTLFRGHFLTSLFPGLTDMPSEFATDAPAPFDECLPELTKNDVETLSTFLPDETSNLTLSCIKPAMEFFNSRSGNKSLQEKSFLSRKLQSIGGPHVLPRAIDMYPHLRDGFESETDTEEFEKVGQSPNERKISAAAAAISIATSTSQLKIETITISTTTEPIAMQAAETLTEITKKSSRLNTFPTSSRSIEQTLPAIPENETSESSPPLSYHYRPSFANENSSISPVQSPLSNLLPILLGHQECQCIEQQHMQIQNHGYCSSPSSPSHQANNIALIDNEFINSEFYIDESLPSSLKGDNEEDDEEEDSSDSCSQQFGDEGIESSHNMETSFSYQCKNRSEDNSCPLDVSLTNNSRESLETVISLLQDNLGSTTLEVERLKGLLKSMSQLSIEALALLKSQIKSAKDEVESNKTQLQDEVRKLSEKWTSIKSDYETKEEEKIKYVQEQHEIALNHAHTAIREKDEEIGGLRNQHKELEEKNTAAANEFQSKQDSLNADLLSLNVKIVELEKKLENAESEKERAVAECCDQIVHQHKTEIESLRCRFKLMTNMERSPSDMSLEKIERPDVIDITSHESIVQQLRDDFENEKARAIEAAIEMERKKWEENQNNSSAPIDIDAFRKIVEEKEKQVDIMRDQNVILANENSQLKVKVDALASEEESDRGYLKDQIDVLNKERARMEQELNAEKMRRMEMESSVAMMKLSSSRELESTSNNARSKTNNSSQSPLKLGVQIESCNRGDTVFIVWNNKHGQYIIVQDSATLYFLHGESHSALNLKAPSSTTSEFPEPYYCVGRVVDKEYCHARKDENRYKVSKGTKFYRVKVQPIIKSESNRHQRRERNESTSSVASNAVSRSTSTQHLIDSFAQTETSGMASTISRDMTDSIDVRDRTVSVTEEDEEQLSLGDRYRCTSFSEEEERILEIESSSTSTLAPETFWDRSQDLNITSTTSSIAAITSTTTNPPPPPPTQIPSECSSEKDQDDSDEYRSLEAKDDTYFSSGIV